MPNLDGGHYFLTVLAPIDNTGIVDHDGMKSSPVHMVRDALETLPTALQSPATRTIGLNSPFSRNTRTHFARFVVLGDVFYNGRDPADAILTALDATDPVVAQPVDHLACPYLLFAADFDPDPDGGAEPRSYLEALWAIMSAELAAAFGYCYGFETVVDGASFADFIVARQVETTMPFNDYWVGAPSLPSLPIWTLIAPPVLAVLAAGAINWGLHSPWWMGLGAVIVLLAAAIGFDYLLVMRAGKQPFPAAPNATLPHVLKALHLQQAFTGFIAGHQGDDPATLHRAFARFVDETRPGDLAGPTQAPGVIRSGADAGWAT
jgi:hypothetical protein